MGCITIAKIPCLRRPTLRQAQGMLFLFAQEKLGKRRAFLRHWGGSGRGTSRSVERTGAAIRAGLLRPLTPTMGPAQRA